MRTFLIGLGVSLSLFVGKTHANESGLYWMKVKANDRFERSYLADQGIAIEMVEKDYVIAFGNKKQADDIKKSGRMITSFEYLSRPLDFPKKDERFHNYNELTQALKDLTQKYPDLVELTSIGKTHENRDIWALRISENVKTDRGNKPAVVFMGGHHAREHLSMEIPLMLAQYLLAETTAQNQSIVRLLASREIHIIPCVNPDGAEWDISTGSYKMWRKNRSTNYDQTKGVDLNRNYGFGWGTGGSSKDPDSETYMGTAPFSEPESLAIKNYVEGAKNISILLSFHTFSELILYPWGHVYDAIPAQQDRLVHENMARTMAAWNGYTPQQSSDLYIASGDTTDWSYGEHKIISFTFELDPKSMWNGGFYPGQGVIQSVFNKNLKPALYLIDMADNPYRALSPLSANYGLSAPILKN